ncbi:MAG: type II secretion system protein GspG [Firmicutes bacterium]|nr:type II secretion system protein GspG [Bacillota bacterium]
MNRKLNALWKRWLVLSSQKDRDEDERGLTLIEMLAVVVILGIVAAIAIPSVTSAINQAKVNSTESTLGTLQTALSRFYMDNGDYPTYLSELVSTTIPSAPSAGAVQQQSIVPTSVVTPSSPPWDGPYIRETFPINDSWGNNIYYAQLDSGAGYVLLSGDGQKLTIPSSSYSNGIDLSDGTAQLVAGSNSSQTVIYASGGDGVGTPPTYIGSGPTKGALPSAIGKSFTSTTDIVNY